GRTFHPFIGKVVEDVSWVPTGGGTNLATRTTSTPTLVPVSYASGLASFWTTVSATTSETFEAPTSAVNPDISLTSDRVLSTTTTTSTLNACGDPTSEVTTRGPGALDRRTTTRMFTTSSSTTACELGVVLLDLLVHEDVKSEEGGLTQHRTTDYAPEFDGTGR